MSSTVNNVFLHLLFSICTPHLVCVDIYSVLFSSFILVYVSFFLLLNTADFPVQCQSYITSHLMGIYGTLYSYTEALCTPIPCIHMSIRPYVYTSLHLYVHMSIHPYIYMSISPCIGVGIPNRVNCFMCKPCRIKSHPNNYGHIFGYWYIILCVRPGT